MNSTVQQKVTRRTEGGQSCTCCADDQVRCDDCYHWNPKTSSYRCQGAAAGVEANGKPIPADMCQTYLCDGCVVRCWGCNLPVCEQHAAKIEGHVQCDTCSLAIAASSVIDLAEALESIPVQFHAAVAAIVAEVRA